METKLSVIEFAEKRIHKCKKINDDDNTRFWCAYLEGAMDQKKEDEKSKFDYKEKELLNHGKWVVTKRHKFMLNKSGNIDTFAWDFGYHNGVICEFCDDSICVNCEPDYETQETCKPHYVCIKCGNVSKSGNEKFCSNCGSNMLE